MTGQYKKITKDIATSLSKLCKEIPDVMNNFTALSQATATEG